MAGIQRDQITKYSYICNIIKSQNNTKKMHLVY